MQFSARGIALFLGLLVALITTLFLSLIRELSIPSLFGAFFVTLGCTFVLIYISLEFIIFRQISKMEIQLRKIHGDEERLTESPQLQSLNPLKKINLEIAEYAEKKQNEINQLKRLETFRREFLADISHELKTPIFAAQGYVHTLLDGAIEDKNVRMKFLKKSAKSLDGLESMVEDLLSLSRLETGEIQMEFQDFDIVELMAEIVDQFEDHLKRKSTNVKINAPEDIWVKADPNRIQQVLTNLLDNAIKYGKPKGTILISFREEDNEKVRIEIRDDGPGIPPEHVNRIFERFYRVEKSRSKKSGGSGLGLSIVKHIIDAHNSNINVDSGIGKGTKFTFYLKKGEEDLEVA